MCALDVLCVPARLQASNLAEKSWHRARSTMNVKATSAPRRPIAWVSEEIEGELVELDVRWFKRLRRPGVYIINGWDGMLYVGMASNLLSRISRPELYAVAKALKDHVQQILFIPAKSEM